MRNNNTWAKITIALFLMFGCAIGIAIVASNANADGPEWTKTLEGRVAHNEGELNDLYGTVSVYATYIRTLQMRVSNLEELAIQNEDRSRALIACVRNRSYTFNRRMMAQCIDDWYDAYAKGDH